MPAVKVKKLKGQEAKAHVVVDQSPMGSLDEKTYKAALKQMRALPKDLQDYWFTHATRMRFIRRIRKWIQEDIPRLRGWAPGFKRDKLFILASGPSLHRVTGAQWKGIRDSGAMVLGVNYVGDWLQKNRGINDLPHLTLVADYMQPGKKGREQLAESLQRLIDNGREVLAGDGSDIFPHTIDGIFLAMMPTWEWELGLTLTATVGGQKWARSILSAMHLAGFLLGKQDGDLAPWRDVYLVGADHGKDYKGTDAETEMANFAFEQMWSFLRDGKINLKNAGECSAVKSIPSVKLDDVLGG